MNWHKYFILTTIDEAIGIFCYATPPFLRAQSYAKSQTKDASVFQIVKRASYCYLFNPYFIVLQKYYI